MKNIKKVLSVALIVTLFAAMSVVSMAAMTTAKQGLLDRANAYGKDLGISGTVEWNNYMAQARTFLTKEDLATYQIGALQNLIDTVADTLDDELVKSGSATYQDMLANDTRRFEIITGQIMDQIEKGLKNDAGLTAKFNDKGELEVVGPSGQTYTMDMATGTTTTTTSAIKATGVNATATVVVVLGLTAVLGACAVVSKKRALVK